MQLYHMKYYDYVLQITYWHLFKKFIQKIEQI